MSVLPTQTCNTTTYLNGQVKSNMICAVTVLEGSNQCNGDIGSPLECNSILYGVATGDATCEVTSLPGLYTNVFEYVDWIKENNSSSVVANIAIVAFSLLIIGFKTLFT